MQALVFSFAPRLGALILLGSVLWFVERRRPWYPVWTYSERSVGANLMLAALTLSLNIFSVWDRCFGTYTAPLEKTRLSFGLDHFDSGNSRAFRQLIGLPFRDVK